MTNAILGDYHKPPNRNAPTTPGEFGLFGRWVHGGEFLITLGDSAGDVLDRLPYALSGYTFLDRERIAKIELRRWVASRRQWEFRMDISVPGTKRKRRVTT